jgi:hypothetical protein
MEPQIFKALAIYLRRNKMVPDSRVKVEEKLGFFLCMLSHNSSSVDLQITFHDSNDTFHHHINHFFKKIISIIARHFLKAPDPNLVHSKMAKNRRFFPFFRNCLGAIDGTHIPISISSEKASPFRNRKGTLNINVMVACDFDLNVTFISSDCEDSTTDSRVLRSTMSKGFQVSPDKFT